MMLLRNNPSVFETERLLIAAFAMPETKETFQYPSLSRNTTADVAIIGGGLAGISTAYFLAKAGKSVVVLENKTIGCGATSKTTAFLTQVIDTSLADLASTFGSRKTKLIWQSHGEAIDTIEQIVTEENIECSFMRCASFCYANTPKEFKTLESEYKTAKRLGIKAEIRPSNFLPFRNSGMLEIPNQGKFNAEKYIKGLAKAASNMGVEIYENTRVTEILHLDDAVWKIGTDKNAGVTATDTIIATYYPLGNPWATFLKKGMYVSYVLELHIPKGALPEAIYEDTANPYNYFRVDNGEKSDTMLIGGADHRAEIKIAPNKNFKAMEDYVKRTFPGLKYKIASKWAGPILEPADGIALIGKTAPHQYVATAFSGNGMTYSTITALLLADLITDRKNMYRELYNPGRIPTLKQLFKKARDYSEELVRGAVKNALR